jgi:arsenite methyltransferase
MVAITSLRKDLILAAVRAMYTDVARYPDRDYHFPTGRAACAFLGYPDERVTPLPESVVDSFAGVAYPFAANVIRSGDVVLDIGSGSGTDLLIAARQSGGVAIGLDMTPAMAEKVRDAAAAADTSDIRMVEGSAEHLPLADASVDVVTSNGVFNLIPDKRAAFAELCRVLRPGGRVQIGDIAVGRPLSGDCVSDPKLWAECIVGATPEDEYVAMLEQAGFDRVEVVGRFDYFAASSSATTRSIAESFRARSIVVRAAKAPSCPLPAAAAWPAAGARLADERSPGGRVEPHADAVLDGHGQACGTLEPLMKARMRTIESGQVLEVRVDDPAARLGVPAWSRLAGHTIVATVEDDDRRTRFFLRKR